MKKASSETKEYGKSRNERMSKALVAQWIAHLASNQKVVGSIPTKGCLLFFFCPPALLPSCPSCPPAPALS